MFVQIQVSSLETRSSEDTILQHTYSLPAPQAQLRFERHSSVQKMFLNMWGAQNHRRQCRQKLLSASFYQINPFKTLVPHNCVCISPHGSLSNLSCVIYFMICFETKLHFLLLNTPSTASHCNKKCRTHTHVYNLPKLCEAGDEKNSCIEPCLSVY